MSSLQFLIVASALLTFPEVGPDGQSFLWANKVRTATACGQLGVASNPERTVAATQVLPVLGTEGPGSSSTASICGPLDQFSSGNTLTDPYWLRCHQIRPQVRAMSSEGYIGQPLCSVGLCVHYAVSLGGPNSI